ncbi:MAG: hypothetical protein WCI31_16970 [Prolixibacteraceae bacterium]
MCRQKGKCGSCTGMVRLAGMKWSLFPASLWGFQVWESRGKRNGIRLEIAKWRKGTTLVVGNRGWWQTMNRMKRKEAERSAALK